MRQRNFGVAVQAAQHVCISGHNFGCSRPVILGVAVQAAQHVCISGQREASPGMKFRPAGASGLVRRPNIREESPLHGPCCGVN